VQYETIIPPTLSCHAASLAYRDGEQLLAWFGGTAEGSCDCRIWGRIGRGGRPRQLVGDREIAVFGLLPDEPMWNPVWAVSPSGGKPMLFFRQGSFCDRWHAFVAVFDDRMDRVESVAALPAGLNGPVKCRPLHRTEGGRKVLVCGASSETRHGWSAYIERYLVDGGRLDEIGSTRRLTAPYGRGVIQPALFELPSGEVSALMRSDSGLLWSWRESSPEGAVPTGIRNPNSAIDVLRLGDGQLLLAYNPLPTDRLPLEIARLELKGPGFVPEVAETVASLETMVSGLEGVDTHPSVAVAYPGGVLNRPIALTPEASYPSMAQTPDGSLACAYTYGRRAIRVACL